MRFQLLAPLLLGALLSFPAHADMLGAAVVTDGDTLRIGKERIRLEGIDAPERNQQCEKAGERYRCGEVSTRALAHLIRGKTVGCRTDGRDRYRRWLAECFTDGISINRRMVAEGHALAYLRYSDAYTDAEAEARRRRAGLWQGAFDPPWIYRKRGGK